MNPEAKVLSADAVAGAATGITPASVAEDQIHAVLRFSGVALLATCMTFIIVEGLDSLSAFTQLNGDSDITEMAKRMAAKPSTSGRVILGTMQIKRLKALVHWVKGHEKRGLIAQPEL